jgi:pre-mRNA-splicing factor ATP-dependent RNA helicase DHX15/PRP43
MSTTAIVRVRFSFTVYSYIRLAFWLTNFVADQHDKNWTWQNYLSARALAQADNVRSQLLRTMERFDIDLVSTSDQRSFYTNIQKALVCGFFMQVAHKEGEKGNYTTVKDNQACVERFQSRM